MKVKNSVFVICVETIIYLLLYNLHYCTCNNLIPIQTSTSSNSFIKTPMPIISITVLFLFQRSMLRARKNLSLIYN